MNIDTKLEAFTHLVNRNQISITTVAYNPRRDEIVVCDGRVLRAWSKKASTDSHRVELTLPQKDMVGRQLFYNGEENQYLLILQGLEIMIINPDLVILCTENTEQVSIIAAAFSPLRQKLVTTGGDGSIKVFGIERFHKTTADGWQSMNRFCLLNVMSGESKWMKHIAINEEDGQILTSHESSVTVWDIEKGDLVSSLADLHTSRIRSLVFIPKDKYLMTSSYDGIIKKWSLAASSSLGKPILVESMQCHTKEVRALVSDATGRILFSCADDLAVKMWNVERAAELDHHVPSSSVASSLATYLCPPPSLLVYADASAGDQGEGLLLVVSGALLSVLRVKEPLLHFSSLSDKIMSLQLVRYSPQGLLAPGDRTLLALSANDALQVLRHSNGRMTAIIVPEGTRMKETPELIRPRPVASSHNGSGLEARITCFHASTGMGHVLLGWHNGSVDIINASDEGRCVHTLADKEMIGAITAIAVVPAPSGRTSLKQRGRSTGDSFDAPQKISSHAKTQDDEIFSFCIITGSSRGHVALWSTSQSGVSRTFGAHTGSVVAIMPFTVSEAHGTNQVWLTPIGPDHGNESFAGPNGMITICTDGTVRLWDMNGLQCVGRGAFRSLAETSVSCALLRGDGGILMGFDDGRLDLWSILPEVLQALHPDMDVGDESPRKAASNLPSGKVARIGRSTEPHSERISSLERSYSGDRFLSASLDGTVLVWHMSSVTALKQLTFSGPVTQAIFYAEDGSLLAVVDDTMLLVSREQVKRARDAHPVQESEAIDDEDSTKENDLQTLPAESAGRRHRRQRDNVSSQPTRLGVSTKGSRTSQTSAPALAQAGAQQCRESTPSTHRIQTAPAGAQPVLEDLRQEAATVVEKPAHFDDRDHELVDLIERSMHLGGSAAASNDSRLCTAALMLVKPKALVGAAPTAGRTRNFRVPQQTIAAKPTVTPEQLELNAHKPPLPILTRQRKCAAIAAGSSSHSDGCSPGCSVGETQPLDENLDSAPLGEFLADAELDALKKQLPAMKKLSETRVDAEMQTHQSLPRRGERVAQSVQLTEEASVQERDVEMVVPNYAGDQESVQATTINERNVSVTSSEGEHATMALDGEIFDGRMTPEGDGRSKEDLGAMEYNYHLMHKHYLGIRLATMSGLASSRRQVAVTRVQPRTSPIGPEPMEGLMKLQPLPEDLHSKPGQKQLSACSSVVSLGNRAHSSATAPKQVDYLPTTQDFELPRSSVRRHTPACPSKIEGPNAPKASPRIVDIKLPEGTFSLEATSRTMQPHPLAGLLIRANGEGDPKMKRTCSARNMSRVSLGEDIRAYNPLLGTQRPATTGGADQMVPGDAGAASAVLSARSAPHETPLTSQVGGNFADEPSSGAVSSCIQRTKEAAEKQVSHWNDTAAPAGLDLASKLDQTSEARQGGQSVFNDERIVHSTLATVPTMSCATSCTPEGYHSSEASIVYDEHTAVSQGVVDHGIAMSFRNTELGNSTISSCDSTGTMGVPSVGRDGRSAQGQGVENHSLLERGEPLQNDEQIHGHYRLLNSNHAAGAQLQTLNHQALDTERSTQDCCSQQIAQSTLEGCTLHTLELQTVSHTVCNACGQSAACEGGRALSQSMSTPEYGVGEHQLPGSSRCESSLLAGASGLQDAGEELSQNTTCTRVVSSQCTSAQENCVSWSAPNVRSQMVQRAAVCDSTPIPRSTGQLDAPGVGQHPNMKGLGALKIHEGRVELRSSTSNVALADVHSYTVDIRADGSSVVVSDEVRLLASNRVHVEGSDWVANLDEGPDLLFSINLYGQEQAKERAVGAVIAEITGAPQEPLTLVTGSARRVSERGSTSQRSRKSEHRKMPEHVTSSGAGQRRGSRLEVVHTGTSATTGRGSVSRSTSGSHMSLQSNSGVEAQPSVDTATLEEMVIVGQSIAAPEARTTGGVDLSKPKDGQESRWRESPLEEVAAGHACHPSSSCNDQGSDEDPMGHAAARTHDDVAARTDRDDSLAVPLSLDAILSSSQNEEEDTSAAASQQAARSRRMSASEIADRALLDSLKVTGRGGVHTGGDAEQDSDGEEEGARAPDVLARALRKSGVILELAQRAAQSDPGHVPLHMDNQAYLRHGFAPLPARTNHGQCVLDPTPVEIMRVNGLRRVHSLDLLKSSANSGVARPLSAGHSPSPLSPAVQKPRKSVKPKVLDPPALKTMDEQSASYSVMQQAPAAAEAQALPVKERKKSLEDYRSGSWHRGKPGRSSKESDPVESAWEMNTRVDTIPEASNQDGEGEHSQHATALLVAIDEPEHQERTQQGQQSWTWADWLASRAGPECDDDNIDIDLDDVDFNYISQRAFDELLEFHSLKTTRVAAFNLDLQDDSEKKAALDRLQHVLAEQDVEVIDNTHTHPTVVEEEVDMQETDCAEAKPEIDPVPTEAAHAVDDDAGDGNARDLALIHAFKQLHSTGLNSSPDSHCDAVCMYCEHVDNLQQRWTGEGREQRAGTAPARSSRAVPGLHVVERPVTASSQHTRLPAIPRRLLHTPKILQYSLLSPRTTSSEAMAVELRQAQRRKEASALRMRRVKAPLPLAARASLPPKMRLPEMESTLKKPLAVLQQPSSSKALEPAHYLAMQAH